jgi:hypothetical protein
MDVFVSRSGGIAGIRLTWHVRVDEQPDADDWFLLIEEIPWNEVPPAPPEPDRFTWDIRCDPASGDPASGEPASGEPVAAPKDDLLASPQEVTLAERQLTGPWRQLVDRVKETAEPRREAPGARRSS